jgi:hypothetical protein
MKIKTGLWIIVGLTTLSIIVPLGIFIYNFRGYPLSPDPADWSHFGEFFGGVAGPLIAIVNLGVVDYIAITLYDWESRRDRQTQAILARPFAYVNTGDYEDHIYVKVQNVGLGPMLITKCESYPITDPEEREVDLVDLMPDLGDNSWTNFTIGGPPGVIPQGGEATLLELKGDDKDRGFRKVRDDIRHRLSKIVVVVEYNDMFGNCMEPGGGLCSAFARHDD